VWLVLAAASALSCEDPDVFVPQQQFGGPAGVIEGSVTYSGPRPCTEGGHILGSAILLGFDVRLLPPPEGLGTTATSLAVVTGDTLFSGVRGLLTFDPAGKRVCPDAKAASVTVSASFSLAPLPGAVYEVRGFYDRDGDFDPSFKISNLPSAGDVGGGAIQNAADVLLGAAPKYRTIGVGAQQPDGTWKIPETGFRVSGVAVTLGLPLPLERPVFYGKTIADPTGKNTDPTKVTMPSDYQLETFSAGNPTATEKSFMRWTLGAGVPDVEVDQAVASPFYLPVKDPTPSFLFTRQDVNGDGVLDAKDHVPDSAQVPSLFPLSIFSKLEPGSALVSQDAPVVVLQGLTIYKSLLSTALSSPDLQDPQPEVTVGLRPAVLCLDPNDAAKPGILLSTHETDTKNNKLIADPDEVKAALSAQFGRPIEIQFGCLPEGDYAANLIYGTGQAWTVPNEAGVCQPGEASKNGGAVCGSRPRLASQAAVLTIGPPGDPAYCKAHPTPAACLPSP
jgi:hypothetical protein